MAKALVYKRQGNSPSAYKTELLAAFSHLMADMDNTHDQACSDEALMLGRNLAPWLIAMDYMHSDIGASTYHDYVGLIYGIVHDSRLDSNGDCDRTDDGTDHGIWWEVRNKANNWVPQGILAIAAAGQFTGNGTLKYWAWKHWNMYVGHVTTSVSDSTLRFGNGGAGPYENYTANFKWTEWDSVHSDLYNSNRSCPLGAWLPNSTFDYTGSCGGRTIRGMPTQELRRAPGYSCCDKDGECACPADMSNCYVEAETPAGYSHGIVGALAVSGFILKKQYAPSLKDDDYTYNPDAPGVHGLALWIAEEEDLEDTNGATTFWDIPQGVSDADQKVNWVPFVVNAWIGSEVLEEPTYEGDVDLERFAGTQWLKSKLNWGP